MAELTSDTRVGDGLDVAPSQITIVHATRLLSSSGGGVARVAWDLGRAQQRMGMEVHWACHEDKELVEVLATNNLSREHRVHAAKSYGPRQLSFAPRFRRATRSAIAPSDVVHIHGIWSSSCHIAADLAKQKRKPYLIAPHGMLDRWALCHRRWRKQIAKTLFEQRFFDGAACVHALVERELQDIRQFGCQRPVAVIPNGIDLDEIDASTSDWPNHRWPELARRPYALFLSRIHPKKGLPLLLTAWKRVVDPRSDWLLVIAGPDENRHVREIRELSERLDIQHQIRLLGPVVGPDKNELFRQAEFFVLSSHSEGFSMAILEALASRCPVIATKECNFPEIATEKAGVICDTNVQSLAEALEHVLSGSGDQLRAMGRRGRSLVARRYSWPRVAGKLQAVYQWLVRGGDVPECVSVDSPRVGPQ